MAPHDDMKEKGLPQVSGATMYDVGRRAKVSAMTVSRVINGNDYVSEATREKVMRAIHELGYRVNVAARAARVGTVRVGLLYSNPSAAFLSAFLVGAMAQCARSGAELILETCEDVGTQRKAIDRLIAHGADGVLVPPPLCDSPAALKRLREIGMPTVAVATAKPAANVSAVRIDDYDGAKAMTNYLLSLGHTDIAFIKGDPDHTPALLPFLLTASRRASLPTSPDSRPRANCWHPNPSLQRSSRPTTTWVPRPSRSPTVCICGSRRTSPSPDSMTRLSRRPFGQS